METRGAVVAIGAYVVGVALALESLTRLLIRVGRLPIAPSSSSETDVSVANIMRAGRPDVLVLGTSAIRSALRPNVLEELIREAIDREVVVRTVAQPALSLEGHRILVDGLARRGLVPQVVILGLTPSTMSGYGDHGEWFPRSELGRLWRSRSPLVDGSSDPYLFGRWSALWRWRHEPAVIRSALTGAHLPRTVGEVERRLTRSGWLSERPLRRFALEQRVPRVLANLPAGVPLPSEHKDSFVALIRELRGHGASVLAVATPYAPQLEAALIERHPGWREERNAGYATLSEAAELPIVVVEAFGDWWEERSQNDLRHLSRRGAGPMTRQLWDLPAFRGPIIDTLAG